MPKGNDQITCTHFTFVSLSSPKEKIGHGDCNAKEKNTLSLNSQTLKRYFIESKVNQKGMRETTIIFEDIWYIASLYSLKEKEVKHFRY